MLYSGGTNRGSSLALQLFQEDLLIKIFQPGKIKNPYPGFFKMHDKCFLPTISSILLAKIYKTLGKKPTKRYWKNVILDFYCSAKVQSNSDIFIGEACTCLQALKRAKNLGHTTFLDRTNSHILFQNSVWEHENKKYKVLFKPNSDRVTQRALNEYKVADFILVLSQFVKKTFLEQGVPEKKILKVSSGIDTKKFLPAIHKKNGNSILFVGSGFVKKGVSYLFDAVALIPPALRPELTIIGGAERGFVQKLQKYGFQAKFYKDLSENEIIQKYQEASFFVFPSLEEGLPKVCLEAMACGLPLIATPEAGAEEYIQEGLNGFIVPSKNPVPLAEKILTLLLHKDCRNQMGQQSRVIAENNFTKEKYYKRFKEIVLTAANKK